MRRIFQILAITTTIAAMGAVPYAGAVPDGKVHKNKFANDGFVEQQCTDRDGNPAGTISYSGPLTLWPPNHWYNVATVTATDEDTGTDANGTADDVTLITTAHHDQIDGDTGTEAEGSGNTADDITPAEETSVMENGSASQEFQIRAERSGRFKAGRTYTITARAMFSDSDADGSSNDFDETEALCEATFTIHVPHDMRPV